MSQVFEATIEVVPTLAEPQLIPDRIIGRMRQFAQMITALDLVGLAPATQKTEYKNVHKGMKRKGGSAPRDFTAVDALVDLHIHLENKEWSEAMSTYFYLKRLVEGS